MQSAHDIAAVDLGNLSPMKQAAAKLDSLLGGFAEIVVALLVAIETLILFAGAVARYVFHLPLVWSDELASILFLWLAMLGAVVAFRRGEHMRMTALVGMCSPPWRAFLDVVAVVAALVFLILALPPSFEYASEERFITTPALEVTNALRAAALPVGFGLMALGAAVRLFLVGGWRQVIVAFLLIAAIILTLWALQPAFKGLGNLNLLIFFVGLVGAAVLAGVPIAFAFALATFGYLELTTQVPMLVLIGRMDEGMSHLILLSVPCSCSSGS